MMRILRRYSQPHNFIEAVMLITRPLTFFALSFMLSPLAIQQAVAESMSQTKSLSPDHVLIKPSSLPFGLPRFADVKDSDFEAAFETAMAEHMKEFNSIAHS